MDFNIDEIIKDAKSVIDVPLLEFTLLGVTFMLWKKPEVFIEICETSPYEPDGNVPLIFIQVAFFEIIFYSKTLYKFLYKRKYNYELDI